MIGRSQLHALGAREHLAGPELLRGRSRFRWRRRDQPARAATPASAPRLLPREAVGVHRNAPISLTRVRGTPRGASRRRVPGTGPGAWSEPGGRLKIGSTRASLGSWPSHQSGMSRRRIRRGAGLPDRGAQEPAEPRRRASVARSPGPESAEPRAKISVCRIGTE